MPDYFVFLGAAVILIEVLLLITVGGPKKQMEFIRKDNAFIGIASVFIVILLVFFLGGLASADEKTARYQITDVYYSQTTLQAVRLSMKPEWEVLPYGYIFFGLDKPIKGRKSPQCDPGQNQIASMITIHQALLRYGRFEWHLFANHQSGATCNDDQVEDTIGTGVLWRWGH